MTRSTRSGSVPLVIALLLSSLLHAGYFFLAKPQDPASTKQVRKSSGLQLVSFSATDPNGQNQPGDALRLYSPALFAFPTSVGFSGSVLNQRLRTPPPRMVRSISDSGLGVNDRTRMSSPPSPQGNLSEATPDPRTLSILPSPNVVKASQPPFGVAVEGDDGFISRAPKTWPAPTVLPDRFWTGSITVNLSENGQVQHVLVEEAVDAKTDTLAWSRWAYGLKFSPGRANHSGRLMVQWIPPGRQDAPTP